MIVSVEQLPANPDHLRGVSEEEAPLMEIVVLGDDREPPLLGKVPNGLVICNVQREVRDGGGAREEVVTLAAILKDRF